MPVVRLKQRAKWNGLMSTSRASASIVRSSGKLLATCSVILESCFGESVAVRRAVPGMLAHRDAMREASVTELAHRNALIAAEALGAAAVRVATDKALRERIAK